MTKRCCICGCEFEPIRKDQKTCGNEECKRIQHKEYLRKYGAERRKTMREAVNKYNREWMRRYRAKQKAEQKEAQSGTADGYAERQKAKTLAKAGRVQT